MIVHAISINSFQLSQVKLRLIINLILLILAPGVLEIRLPDFGLGRNFIVELDTSLNLMSNSDQMIPQISRN